MKHTGEKTPDAASAIVMAHVTCLFLGVGMLFWGIAPAVIQRLLTGQSPSVRLLLMNGTIFVLGVAFIGMHVLVRRRVVWAIWSAFTASAFLSAAGFAMVTISKVHVGSSFLLLLAACCCFTSWLAIAHVSRARTNLKRQPSPE